MKSLRILGILAIASLALVAVSDEKIKLRRTLTEGAVETYKVASVIDNQVDVSAFGGGTQNMKIESNMTVAFKTGKLSEDKRSAVSTVDITDLDIKMEGGMASQMGMDNIPKTFKVSGKLSDLNQFSDIKIEGLPPAVMQFASGSVMAVLNTMNFPEGELVVGDTWDVTYPKTPAFGEMTPKIKAKLIAIKKVDDVDAYEIKLTGPMDMKIDPAAIAKETGQEQTGPMAGMKMMITGTVTVDSVITINKATGAMIMLDSSGDSNMKVEMTDMGMNLPITGKTTTIIKKVK